MTGVSDGPLGERQMRVHQWGELPACRSWRIRKLEAYATVRNQPPLALMRLLPHLPADRDVGHAVAASGPIALAVALLIGACQPQTVIVKEEVKVTEIVEIEKEVTKIVETEKIVEVAGVSQRQSPLLQEQIQSGALPTLEERLPVSPLVAPMMFRRLSERSKSSSKRLPRPKSPT